MDNTKTLRSITGILIVGLAGHGKSFVGNLLCPEPKPFVECDFSAPTGPAMFGVCQFDTHKIVDTDHTLIEKAAKSFSKACRLDKLVIVHNGPIIDTTVPWIKSLVKLCPQPSEVILVHNRCKKNPDLAQKVYDIVQNCLSSTIWYYVDVKVVQLAYENDGNFQESVDALRLAIK